jgi:hypothetical protein
MANKILFFGATPLSTLTIPFETGIKDATSHKLPSAQSLWRDVHRKKGFPVTLTSVQIG